jgi:preprotein translocase subunit SecG
MSNPLMYVLLWAFIIVSVLLILIVLIQKGRGGGLASAFGGMGGHTAFGSKTGDVLTWATSVMFGVFLLLAIGLNLWTNRSAPAPNTSAPPANGVPAQQPPFPTNTPTQGQ